jgi:hypothetical protein
VNSFAWSLGTGFFYHALCTSVSGLQGAQAHSSMQPDWGPNRTKKSCTDFGGGVNVRLCIATVEWELVFNIKVPSFPSIVQHIIIILTMAPLPPFSGLVSGSGFSLEDIKSILEALVPEVRGNTHVYAIC